MQINAKKTKEGMLISFEDYKKIIDKLEELEDSLELKQAIENKDNEFISIEELRKTLEEEGKL